MKNDKSIKRMFDFLEEKNYKFMEKIEKCNDYIFKNIYL